MPTIQTNNPKKHPVDKYKILIIIIFLVGIFLRLSLACVNKESNDNFMHPIKIILNENRLPTRDDCHEGYQPPFYFLTSAALIKMLPQCSERFHVITAQLVSCCAGIFTLWLIFFFIDSFVNNARIKLISFSMAALNPGLIAINGQTTNDSFVILFGTAAIFYAYKFFSYPSTRSFLFMIITALLASLSKGNGIVISIAIVIVFTMVLSIRTYYHSHLQKNILWYFFTFIVAFLLIVPFGGRYYYNYKKYGSPFAGTYFPNQPAVNFFEPTYVLRPGVTSIDHTYKTFRPGVTSIVNTYMTFRIFDLIKNPITTNDIEVYPLHRTSLWTQLYGRAHFIHFAAWPFTWKTNNLIILNIGRAIFVLALIPSCMLIVGLVGKVISQSKSFFFCSSFKFPPAHEIFLAITLMGYFSFIILYTCMYRDFSFMKEIFLYPAIPCFIYYFSEGYSACLQASQKLKISTIGLHITLCMLFVLYSINVLILVTQLFFRNGTYKYIKYLIST